MSTKALFLILQLTQLVCPLLLDSSAQRPLQGSSELPLKGPRVVYSEGTATGVVISDGFPQSVEAFLGIPYSLPPVADRRLRPLEPLPRNTAREVDATKFGPICHGKQLVDFGPLEGSEDCLTVNIFRPEGLQKGRKVPVAVYVHGGAFNRGTAKFHKTASMVAWSEEPFIGVTFNYRIGALGFLPSAVTAKEGILNLGLRDQVFLLEWIQENIGYFGGDKESVTLFGLSAGAHSIGHHLLHQSSDNTLFHRVIIESGGPTARAIHVPDASLHKEQFDHFLRETGCPDTPSTNITTCLRSLPTKIIVNSSLRVFDAYNPSLRWAFQPVIDGSFIRTWPVDSWTSGTWNHVPILTGHNTNEGSYYVPASLSTSTDFREFFHTLLPHFNATALAEIDRLYPDPSEDPQSPYTDTRDLRALGLGPQFKRAEQTYAHYAYSCPVRQTVHFASTSPPEVRPPVWLYHWALNKTVRDGANHADNAEYETYDAGVRAISPAQERVAAAMHSYLTSFIIKGDPNVLPGRWESRPKWELYSGSEEGIGRAMVFGKGNDERAGGDSVGVPAEMDEGGGLAEECAFWWRMTQFPED